MDSVSTDLCTSCGLCCNGVLFDWVPVEADERARLEALGLPVVRHEGGHRFAQCCPMFDGTFCTIYAQCPSACRRFRCELLKKVEGGMVELGEARKIVVRAKRMLNDVRPLLPEDDRKENVGKQWAVLFGDWQARAPSARSDPARARLLLQLTALNRFLDRHFRSEKQRRVMED
jgi:Fe-S-cluster containining protein